MTGVTPRGHDTPRLFFALWPDEAARAALAGLVRSLHRQCGGRPVPEHKLHLTLLFLGSVRTELVAGLRHFASEVKVPADTLLLDRLEHWRRQELVCLGASRCPASLSLLAARLARSVRGLDLRVEERPYVPHITLLRRAPRRPEVCDVEPISWRIAGFVLVRSAPGRDVAYEVIDQWPLQGAN